MHRREFIKTGAAGGALITLGTGAPGCGNNVHAAPLADVTASESSRFGVATINDTPGTDGYGTIRLNSTFYPDLNQVGGALTLRLSLPPSTARTYPVPPDKTVLLVQYDLGKFAAVQSSCPHEGCPLGYSAKDHKVECPCHASTFTLVADPNDPNSIAGQALHLPARSPLDSWDVSFMVSESGVIVDLNSGGFPDIVGGMLTIPVMSYPALAVAGGSVRKYARGYPHPIIVVRKDAQTVLALDATCTHQQCPVDWSQANMNFPCPCHGSSFSTTGAVLSPPATLPLKAFTAALSTDGATITVTVA